MIKQNLDNEWEDPIVAQIRAVRNSHAQEFNFDPNLMFDDIIKKQEELKKQGYILTNRSLKKFPKQNPSGLK